MWPTFLNKIWDTRPSQQDMLRKVRFFYLITHLPSRSSQPHNQPVTNSKSLQSMPRTGEYNVQLTQVLYLATAPATDLITFVSIPLQSLSWKSALKNFVVQKSKSKFPKSALAEVYVDKQRAGKKGGRNKNKYRPSKQQSTAAEVPQGSTNGVYTELHHNDNPFVIRLLLTEAKQYKTCKVDFCHRHLQTFASIRSSTCLVYVNMYCVSYVFCFLHELKQRSSDTTGWH